MPCRLKKVCGSFRRWMIWPSPFFSPSSSPFPSTTWVKVVSNRFGENARIGLVCKRWGDSLCRLWLRNRGWLFLAFLLQKPALNPGPLRMGPYNTMYGSDLSHWYGIPHYPLGIRNNPNWQPVSKTESLEQALYFLSGPLPFLRFIMLCASLVSHHSVQKTP